MPTYTEDGVRVDVSKNEASVQGYGDKRHVEACKFYGRPEKCAAALKRLADEYAASDEPGVAAALRSIVHKIENPIDWHRIRPGEYVARQGLTRYELRKQGVREWILTVKGEDGLAFIHAYGTKREAQDAARKVEVKLSEK